MGFKLIFFLIGALMIVYGFVVLNAGAVPLVGSYFLAALPGAPLILGNIYIYFVISGIIVGIGLI